MQAQKGFSLIELIIALAILAILASIAYSSYSSQVQKSRRTDVTEALMKAAALQERFFLSTTPNRYATQAEINEIGGAATSKGYYSIRVINTAAHTQTSGCDGGICFTISGVVNAGGAQSNDSNCQMFTIDNLGRKRSYSAVSESFDADQTEGCW